MLTMIALGPTVDTSTLWQVLFVVVIVVVVGVLALITTLLFIVRSVSTSVRQLQEVYAEQAARAAGVQLPGAQPGAAGSAVPPDPAPAPADATGAPVETSAAGGAEDASGQVTADADGRPLHQSDAKGSAGSSDA